MEQRYEIRTDQGLDYLYIYLIYRARLLSVRHRCICVTEALCYEFRTFSVSPAEFDAINTPRIRAETEGKESMQSCVWGVSSGED